jgi:hypothetical protein
MDWWCEGLNRINVTPDTDHLLVLVPRRHAAARRDHRNRCWFCGGTSAPASQFINNLFRQPTVGGTGSVYAFVADLVKTGENSDGTVRCQVPEPARRQAAEPKTLMPPT